MTKLEAVEVCRLTCKHCGDGNEPRQWQGHWQHQLNNQNLTEIALCSADRFRNSSYGELLKANG